jgi:hypothetical protein
MFLSWLDIMALAWMYRRLGYKYTAGWMDGWMDGWMNGFSCSFPLRGSFHRNESWTIHMPLMLIPSIYCD